VGKDLLVRAGVDDEERVLVGRGRDGGDGEDGGEGGERK
jgi:hypothetical protein